MKCFERGIRVLKQEHFLLLEDRRPCHLEDMIFHLDKETRSKKKKEGNSLFGAA